VSSRRPLDPEWMDLPTFDQPQVAGTFRFIEIVNRWLGGTAALISFFARESHEWPAGRVYRVLDAGCGSGDCAAALARWARRRGVRLRIDAFDNQPLAVDLARRNCGAFPEITCARRDVFALEGQRYDYVIMSMFLHHFPDEQVPSVLGHLLALCRRKLIVNDLVRSPLHYAGTWLFTLLTSDVFRHDARLSVRKGFAPAELEQLLHDHGIGDFRLERRFFYRFLLIVSKEASS
jgi:2-polyprenyl-3-methyl-5-hydroxy-6-metoxy-1,4-benzoquinol methylase